MRRISIALAACALVASVSLIADDFSVQADPRANFALFQTFAMREAKLASKRPELDNSLFEKKLSRAIRDALVAKGLKEVATKPDLQVNFDLSGEEVSTTQRGVGAGPVSVRYTVGTLRIELTRTGETDPVWRAIYRDDEAAGSKLVTKLPEDARKLIDKLPRK